MTAQVFQKIVTKADPILLCDALSLLSGLSKLRIKEAMNKGAVWLRRGEGKKERIRRAKAKISPGDGIFLYYAPEILAREAPVARLMKDAGEYSIWYKPAGLLSQGSLFGDHCALPRQIEAHFSPKRAVHLVHRLDREVDGLMLVAHGKEAAEALSSLLRENRIEKGYQAVLKGDLRGVPGEISLPLGGKEARTSFEVTGYDAAKDESTARITIQTGRLHQIRRHFDLIGHPVMGDPRYGEGNASPEGLKLTAWFLAFDCPLGQGRVEVSIF